MASIQTESATPNTVIQTESATPTTGIHTDQIINTNYCHPYRPNQQHQLLPFQSPPQYVYPHQQQLHPHFNYQHQQDFNQPQQQPHNNYSSPQNVQHRHGINSQDQEENQIQSPFAEVI
jgi:hypothetical protein